MPDILRLSCIKGGTSVLADAYLPAGQLTQDQAGFAFHWGVLLQLADELQDLTDDLQRGSVTLFSLAVKREPLDALTNRLLHFAERVLSRADCLGSSSPELRDLLRRSCRSLLLCAVGDASAFYTPAYLRHLETFSPVRFDFLQKNRDRISITGALGDDLFRALLDDPVVCNGTRTATVL